MAVGEGNSTQALAFTHTRSASRHHIKKNGYTTFRVAIGFKCCPPASIKPPDSLKKTHIQMLHFQLFLTPTAHPMIDVKIVKKLFLKQVHNHSHVHALSHTICIHICTIYTLLYLPCVHGLTLKLEIFVCSPYNGWNESSMTMTSSRSQQQSLAGPTYRGASEYTIDCW